MGITIGQSGAVAASGGLGAAAAIGTALQAQVQSQQTAEVEALFSSIGLGSNTNALA